MYELINMKTYDINLSLSDYKVFLQEPYIYNIRKSDKIPLNAIFITNRRFVI